MSVEPWTQTPVYTISGIGPYEIKHPYVEDAIRPSVIVGNDWVALNPTEFLLNPLTSTTSGNLYLTPAAATTHAGRSLVISRVTPDQQGWLPLRGEREAGLAAQLDRMVQSLQEVRAGIEGTLRIRDPLDPFVWADGTVPVRSGDSVISGPTAIEIIGAQGFAATAAAAAAAAEASAAEVLTRLLEQLIPRQNWQTGAYYQVNSVVYVNGSSYYALTPHFATVFATDLAAGKWFILAQAGAAGAGTGDMLKSELLSGLSNYPQARANLGLGALATLNLVGFSNFDPAGIISDIEGLAANKLANAIPVAKAVTDYFDARAVPEAPLASFTVSANTNSIPLINLAGWDQVEVVGELTGAGTAGVQVSPDNGTTWRVGGYDGRIIDGVGADGIGNAMTMMRGATSAAGTVRFRMGLDQMASPVRRTGFISDLYVLGGNRNNEAQGVHSTPEICTALRIVGATFSGGWAEVRGIRRAVPAVVGDTTPPTIFGTSPADNAVGVTLASNLSITFSEAIVFGAGFVTLRHNIAGVWSDLETFNVVSAVGSGPGQMFIAGSVLTINPTADFVAGREYAIRAGNGSIRDAAGNPFAGIGDDTTFSFTAAVGTGAPSFVTLTVANNLVTFQASGPASFRWSFDDVASPAAAAIAAGTGAYSFGNITALPGLTNETTLPTTGVPAGARKLHIVLSNVGGTVYGTPQHFDVIVAAADSTAPTLISSSPADNATAVSLSASPSLTFSENVVPGSGVFTLRQNIAGTWSDVETFNVLSSVGTGPGQINFAGPTVTLNPTTDFASSREYAIRVANGAVKDAAGNPFAGIANDTTISFTAAAADVTAPTLTSSSPADNATSVALAVSPSLTFSEPVFPGTGNVTLRQNIAGTWSDVEAFNVVSEIGTSNGQINFSGGIVTINPTADLTAGREYAIRVDATAIKDAANNPFAGIANDTTVSFTATAANPELLVDPGFGNAGVWNIPTGMAITGGKLVFSSPASFAGIEAQGNQWAPVSASTLYKYGVDVVALGTAGAGLRVRLEVVYWKGPNAGAGFATPSSEQLGGSTVTISATGRLEYNFTTPSDCTHVQYSLIAIDTGMTYEFDNASIKAV